MPVRLRVSMPRDLSYLPALDDLMEAGRCRLPRLVRDYLDGGAGDESSLERNRRALETIRLLPRYGRDVADRTTVSEVFGRSYAMPLGIAPVGLADFIWPNMDATLAASAEAADVPYILSTAASTTIERAAELAPRSLWFQLYVSTDDAVTFDLVERAKRVGVEVLVVTIDIPVPGKRLRDLRNGFRLPFRPTVGSAAGILAHPAWALAKLRAGTPNFATLAPYAQAGSGAQSLAAFMARQITGRLQPALLRRIRKAWPGRMVLKGLLSPEDVDMAVAVGADGVIVSNHGGRQLDAAPAAIEMLPAVAQRAGDRLTVMMDGGLRSGSDVARALASGACFTFAARPFLLAVAARGRSGADHALCLLADEVSRVLGLTGHTDPSQLSDAALWEGPRAGM